MLNVAARAKGSIELPSRGVTQREIMKMFKRYLRDFKQRFEVCPSLSSLILFTDNLHLLCKGPSVTGQISLTCDAWQASNVDGYFAVTAHWIEEKFPNNWTLEGAVIGFVRMNESHNGRRLGQALYKVAMRLGIAQRVCNLDSHVDMLTLTSDLPCYLR